MRAFAELTENRKRIEVRFTYSLDAVAAVKTVAGARFVPRDKGGPYWTVPMDLEAARQLRQAFGKELELGAAVAQWGRDAVSQERNLTSLAVASDAEMVRLPELLPELHASLRDYQRAGAAFVACSPNPLVGDQQRLGKTRQVIAGIFEAGLGDGAHLVIAPKTAMVTAWEEELARVQPHPALVCPEGKAARADVLDEAQQMHMAGKPFWLVVPHSMARFERHYEPCGYHVGGATAKEMRSCSLCEVVVLPKYDQLIAIEFSSVTVDEFHKQGLGDPKSLLSVGMAKLRTSKRVAMSGTPMGGREIKLWGVLHWLNPEVYTSKWRWAEQWLQIDDNGFGKTIGGLLPDRKEEFYRSLTPYVLRRTRKDVRPELPDHDIIPVWVEMGTKQAKQYGSFAQDAEVRIDEMQLTAASVLAEYAYLKQFANALCTVDDEDRVTPTEESAKLEALWERLEEAGHPDAGADPVVIFSQFRRFVLMIHGFLVSKGVAVEMIHGGTKQRDRDSIMRRFQGGELNALVVTTTAGGVGIKLDRADTVHIMDETWNPDDQEQAMDRIIDMDKVTKPAAYVYRSRGTVEEYIEEITSGKADVNLEILDLRRQGLRATGGTT